MYFLAFLTALGHGAMSVYAVYQGIQYEITEVGDGQWRWEFVPPHGPRRIGRAIGTPEWAFTVVRRAIQVWHLMNRRKAKEFGKEAA